MSLNEAKRWLSFAEEDLRVAELAMQASIYNQACFHAQQCVEKCLKALFVVRDEVAPKTHAISKLLALLKEHPFTDLESSLILLDRFYIPTRYPDALPGTLPEGLPAEKDAREALRLAQEVYKLTRRLMEKKSE